MPTAPSPTSPADPSQPAAGSSPGAGAAFDPTPVIAAELQLQRGQVAAVIALLDGGATVPFISR
ncbi:MAG: hypothetical protein KC431_13100, partial [Myxococcales bacterium]|nr:hypothetical protein [Myxococcales bacterium]